MTDFSDLTRELEEEFREMSELPIGSNLAEGEAIDDEQFDEDVQPGADETGTGSTDVDETVKPDGAAEQNSEPEEIAGKEDLADDSEHDGTEVKTEAEPTAEKAKKRGPFAVIRERLKQRDRLISTELDIMIALLPLVAWGVYAYGTRVLAVVLTGILSAMVSDIIGIAIFRRKIEFPLSASAVTGTIIALSCPASVPLWAVAAASAGAVIIVKNLLNGSGLLPLNPSATAVALLYIAMPAVMTSIPQFGSRAGFFGGGYDMAQTTELARLLEGRMPETSVGAMIVGLRSGGIGHISAVLIIGAFIYLLMRKAVRGDVMAGFLITVGVYFYLNPKLLIVSDVLALKYALYQLLCADTLFTVVFIASAPVSCPKTSRGRLVAGVAGGLATALARVYVGGEISVVLAALVISLLSRPLDLVFQPMGVFGGAVRKPKKQKTSSNENET
ncbi:MAG: RnfABCDGE type electron transport complex subunit D [Clostridia bacterium]|nr:RnfABCDGE type electron transport complex subunit D [Clostridia bacterium]